MTRIAQDFTQATEQQLTLENNAAMLLRLVDAYVPHNVAHYAVEDLRHALKQYLLPGTPSVHTRDVDQVITPPPAERTQHSIDMELAQMAADEEQVMHLVQVHGKVYVNEPGTDLALAIVRLAARGTLVHKDRGYVLAP